MDRGRAYDDGKADGPKEWMSMWTTFFWGFWYSYAPFVGIFLAKISRGRTIREFINGSMTTPIIFVFFWVTNFGGSGLKMEREAAGLSLCCDHRLNLSAVALRASEYHNAAFNRSVVFENDDLNQLPVKLPVVDHSLCDQSKGCDQCSDSFWKRYAPKLSEVESASPVTSEPDVKTFPLPPPSSYATMASFLTSIANGSLHANMPTPFRGGRREIVRLSCLEVEHQWFALLRSYGGLGQFLSVISMGAIVLYFVTSADSAALVIDSLSANGSETTPRVQRAFWSLMVRLL